MNLHFWKMHGAGNDFILIDNRGPSAPLTDQGWIKKACAGHEGIGAQGLILLQPAVNASFSMRFFNPDGNEAEMCGNGIRCAARLAHDLKIAGQAMAIQTRAGILRANIEPHGVRVGMPPPTGIRLNFSVKIADERITCSFVNTGVPHVVVEAEELEKVDLPRLGPLLRWHEDFAPQGANVDYLRITGRRALKARTYERGVEAETPACGTGLTACAVIAALNNKVEPPVQATCRHGDILEVDFRISAGGVDNVTLRGPAEYVFEGTIRYPD